MCRRSAHLAILSFIVCLGSPAVVGRADIVQPASGTFQEVPVASGLVAPTAMEFAPDGRLFVTQQGGALRVIKNGALLSTPFATFSVTSNGERGLLGIAFDPAFASTRWVYIYYTRSASPVKNRVSRVRASASNPDLMEAGSEQILLDDIASDAGNHNGGAIHFGLDGKLYIAVGDGGATATNSQNLGTLSGKLLRINPDGTVPTDNPFVSTAGARPEIWALGFRNPYTFAVDPATGTIHVNDVGQNTWEEVNLLTRGANYGWPTCEGFCGTAGMTNPLHAYAHGGGSAAITGGAFYRGAQFPAQYVGAYFFADYLSGFIRQLTGPNTAADFATALAGPVDLKVGPDGSLYWLSIFDGAVSKFQYSTAGNVPPTAVLSVNPMSGAVPLTVAFSGAGSSDPNNDPLTYSWDFGDGTPNGSGVSVNHTYPQAGAFTAVLTVQDGQGGSDTASVVISAGGPPSASILSPTAGALYTAGDTINYSGSGFDPDETLPDSAFSWTIVFHHSTHTHPFLGPVNGARSGSFQVPQTGESAADVFYRIHLTVTDSTGLTHTVFRDVRPRVATVTLTTVPAGLQVTLDGQPQTAPLSFTSVAGFIRTIGASATQVLNGTTYDFVSWSDGGAASHAIQPPAGSLAYTATYQARVAGSTTLTPSPTSVATGGAVSVSWAMTGRAPTSTDWIGLFRVGDPHTGTRHWWQYTGGAASGTKNLTAPTTPGSYEFRIFAQNGYTLLATSATVTVTGASGTFTLTPSPTSVAAGGALSVSWTMTGRAPTSTDWIGLFRVGDPNTGTRYWWQYTGGTASGTKNLTAPTTANNYEFRLFAANSYTLLATSAQVAVGGGAPPAPTLAFSANPTTINAGSSSTLSWTTTNATGCTASGGWSGAKAANGSQAVTPSATTTFNLVCTGPGGTSPTRSVTVTVNAGPTVPTASLTANPTTITSGQSSTLTWGSSNATSCTSGGGFTTAGATSGTAVVSPTASTTYIVSCSGPSGTSQAVSATVTVLGPMTITVTPFPTTVMTGGPISVSWSMTGRTPTGTDWVGLFRTGTPVNSTRYWWAYTGGLASGTKNLTAPAAAGTYEFRLFAQNSYTLLGTSAPVTVNAP